MGFNRRKLEAEQKAKADAAAALRRATDAQVLEDAERLIAAWNERQAKRIAALEALRARRIELDQLAAKLDCEERNTLVEGELDARPMGIGKGPKPPSYNLQTAGGLSIC